MLGPCLDWLDRRTGYRSLFQTRMLPDGPHWEYVTGSCLLWLLIVEVVTGLLLMATYSPSTTSAWASIHYIEQMDGGPFLRGLHYFTGQALVIAFAVHTVRVLLAASFRAPHELVWVTGLLLIPVILVWAITGNPLAWTQRGYAQIEVESNILGSTPLVGPVLKRILVGGSELGHLTLTHLYTLHVAFFPLVAAVLLVIHISQVFRHGLSFMSRGHEGGTEVPYWPYQTVRNLTAVALMLAVISALAWRFGAPLDAPADATLPHTPRPEWYFLFLFELRGYFSGEWEFIATSVLPSAALVVLLAMPLFDRILPTRLSIAMRVLVVAGGVAAWSGLTWAALARDWKDPDFRASREATAQLAERARELADLGPLPPEGAITLLRTDAKTQGPQIFETHCAGCHHRGDENSEEEAAPDLTGFGTATWIEAFLRNPTAPEYFGQTKHREGSMAQWAEENLEMMSDDEIKGIASFLASQAKRQDIPPPNPELVEIGLEVFAVGSEEGAQACSDCHKLQHEEILHGEVVPSPNLTGYGSKQWLRGIISDPTHVDFYGKANDRMPAFKDELSSEQIDMIVTWMRGEWRRSGQESPTLASGPQKNETADVSDGNPGESGLPE